MPPETVLPIWPAQRRIKHLRGIISPPPQYEVGMRLGRQWRRDRVSWEHVSGPYWKSLAGLNYVWLGLSLVHQSELIMVCEWRYDKMKQPPIGEERSDGYRVLFWLNDSHHRVQCQSFCCMEPRFFLELSWRKLDCLDSEQVAAWQGKWLVCGWYLESWVRMFSWYCRMNWEGGRGHICHTKMQIGKGVFGMCSSTMQVILPQTMADKKAWKPAPYL